MGVIWDRIINPSTLQERKIVIIDEAWSFLADPSFFAVVEMMCRTLRKFFKPRWGLRIAFCLALAWASCCPPWPACSSRC